jgi:hypothetical protein
VGCLTVWTWYAKLSFEIAPQCRMTRARGRAAVQARHVDAAWDLVSAKASELLAARSS